MNCVQVEVKPRRASRKRLANLDCPPSQFARWRAAVGLRMDDAAAFFGVTERTISSWETGRVTPKRGVRLAMRQRFESGVEEPWPE